MYGSSVAQENHLCSRKICFSPITCICNEKPETVAELSLSYYKDDPDPTPGTHQKVPVRNPVWCRPTVPGVPFTASLPLNMNRIAENHLGKK